MSATTGRRWVGDRARHAAPSVVEAAVRVAVAGGGDPTHLRRAIEPLLAQEEAPDAAMVLAAVEERLERRCTDDELEAAGTALQQLGCAVVLVGHAGYPAALATAWPELGAPVWLFARWPQPIPDGPAVAIVGTRQPTLDGLRTARELAWLLATHGVTVVSGMARGIDQAAHRGALEADGRTVGVLGTGLDVDYPRGDAALREEVAASGGLLTELIPGAAPRPRHFLWRNRLISGLADVTVVVEGRARSGSLQTARLAASQGRDVWAVPGSLHAPASQGPLALVRDGAQLITRLEDVLDAVHAVHAIHVDPRARRTDGEMPAGLGDDAAVLLPLLGAVPSSAGSLAGASGLPLPRVLAAVAELTDRGAAVVTARGVCRRR